MKRRHRYVIVFVLLVGVCLYWSARLHWAISLLLINVAAAFLVVAGAYALGRAGMLLKKNDGRIRPLGWVVLWPYLLLNWVILRLYTAISNERPFDAIDQNVYLGRRLSNTETRFHFPEGVAATIDLTAEFNEPRHLRRGRYLLIPTLDTLEPTPDQLADAVRLIVNARQDGPVYIHCAMGHGRSATIIAAWLISTERLTVEEAIARIKAKRRGIGLHREQYELLDQVTTHGS